MRGDPEKPPCASHIPSIDSLERKDIIQAFVAPQYFQTPRADMVFVEMFRGQSPHIISVFLNSDTLNISANIATNRSRAWTPSVFAVIGWNLPNYRPKRARAESGKSKEDDQRKHYCNCTGSGEGGNFYMGVSKYCFFLHRLNGYFRTKDCSWNALATQIRG